ncbi:hypothetical protein [Nocardia sp. NPDC059228]|uniref:hypothetical protein n=1 Tax=Nocardia sp. NPDC059228 TaxID=3346777 RepID=UPI0036A24700
MTTKLGSQERITLPHTALTEPASAGTRKINGQNIVRPPAVRAPAELRVSVWLTGTMSSRPLTSVVTVSNR